MTDERIAPGRNTIPHADVEGALHAGSRDQEIAPEFAIDVGERGDDFFEPPVDDLGNASEP
jgi:hypothetical protein